MATEKASYEIHKIFWIYYLFPWWPLQALLHTRRIIFSGPIILLGDADGVTAPCMKDGVLLISDPYFKLLWFKFASRLPVKDKKCVSTRYSFKKCKNLTAKKNYLPLFVRMFSSLKVSGVSKANMESLSWMMSRSSSSSQNERWKPS